MSLTSQAKRLAHLERAVGVGDGPLCTCRIDSVDMRYYPGDDSETDAERDETPGATCERCGRPQRLIKIVIVRTPPKMTDAEWRALAEGKQ